MNRYTTATAVLQRVIAADRPAWVRWTFSVFLFALALTARLAVDHELPPGFPYLTFFPAVIITTFVAGLWPGILCGVLCGLASWYFFIVPFYSIELTPGSALALGFYAFIVTVDIIIIHGISVTSRQLRKEREELARVVALKEQALEKLKASDEQQQILKHELSHRLKNTLAMVQAIATQTLRPVEERQHVDAFEKRLQALSSAHDILLQRDWANASIEAIVRETTHRLVLAERLKAQGPEISLGPRATLSLSLLLHELTTNATKYGSLSNDYGYVCLTWRVSGAGEEEILQIDWQEHDGPPVSPPLRKGFGSRLIRMGLPGTGKVNTTYERSGFQALFQARLRELEEQA
jgi:two-component sensor histidine kinase